MSDAWSGPLVSVVIPFYNTDRYLEECIRSVLSQTYRNIEVILQDNCSTDRSPAIARSFAESDDRIRLVQNETFLSQVQNYNAALRKISPASEYTKIVQADDTIYPRCLEEMVQVAESDPEVGLVSSFSLNGNRIAHDGFPFADGVISGREVAAYELRHRTRFHSSPTTVMYRSEIVRSRRPFYDEGKEHEDTENCFELLERWKFGFVPQVLSSCRVEHESILGQLRGVERDWSLVEALIMLRRFGPLFLSESEYSEQRADLERTYRDHLGFSALFARAPEFWRFHRKSLTPLGYDLRPAAIRKLAAAYWLSVPFRPRQVLKVLRHLRTLTGSWFAGSSATGVRAARRRPRAAPTDDDATSSLPRLGHPTEHSTL